MSLNELITTLKQVRWSPSSRTSVLLHNKGIIHGFNGLSDHHPPESLVPHYPKQIHGTKILPVDPGNRFSAPQRPDGDGIYTNKPGPEVLAIRTADCLPVLLASPTHNFATAIHAGWRGFTAGILHNAVDLSTQHGALQNTIFAIGPAISRDIFEVGPEVVDAILSPTCGLSETAQALVISKGRTDRWHVDLQLAAVCQLLARGIAPTNIEVIRACTYLDTDTTTQQKIWNSYRRDGGGCASNWSWIRIKEISL